MRTSRIVVCVVLVCVAACALAQQPSAVGTWKLNLSKSDFGKQPAPKSATIVITDDKDNSLKWTYKYVAADGKVTNDSFAGAFDGKPYPVKGDPMFATGAFTRKGSDISIAWKMKDGSTETETSTMSGDTMTNKTSGKSGATTQVWERVKTASAMAAKAGQKKSPVTPAAKKSVSK